MLLMIAVFTGALALLYFLEGGSRKTAINEFCSAECRDNPVKHYKFCC